MEQLGGGNYSAAHFFLTYFIGILTMKKLFRKMGRSCFGSDRTISRFSPSFSAHRRLALVLLPLFSRHNLSLGGKKKWATH